MPREITNEDGSKTTVYEESEVADLKTHAEKVEALKKELGVDGDVTIEQKLSELKEMANPNFAKFRKKFDAMERELKTAGKEFDENGNPLSGVKPLSSEEIARMTESAVKSALSNKEKEKALSALKPEERQVVEHYLSKLEATGGSFEENMELAMAKAFPDKASRPYVSFGSSGNLPPRFASETKPRFTDTDEGKSALNLITGKK